MTVARSAAAGDAALAEVLFQEGKKLMAERRFAEACPKLAESQRLDPAGGTLTALALCHEGEGKTATAWTEFEAVLAEARRNGRADRQSVAKEHLALLEAQLTKLTVTVAPATAALSGLEVKRDGATIGPPSWGVAAPIDPGVHTLEATAPGRRPWRIVVTASRPGEAHAVHVPELELVAPPPIASASASPSASPSASAPIVTPPGREARSNTAGYVVGGAGFVALGVGAIFGLQAITTAKRANDRCPTPECADADARADSASARRSATISDVGFGLGIVALGISGYLLLAPRATAADARVTGLRLGSTVQSDGVAWSLGGRW